jgi:hypothetical protein
MAGGVEGAFQVDRDHGVPVLLLHLEDHAVPQDPGHVDQDVEPPEFGDRPLDEPPAGVEVSNVRRVNKGHTASLGDAGDDVLRRPNVGACAVDSHSCIRDQD